MEGGDNLTWTLPTAEGGRMVRGYSLPERCGGS